MSSAVQAFASGSFIYVALVEILLPEFDNRQVCTVAIVCARACVCVSFSIDRWRCALKCRHCCQDKLAKFSALLGGVALMLSL